jgi:hypothetical protein
MQRTAITISAFAFILLFSFAKSPQTSSETVEPKKIQVAILLDVSNSMDGLIEQAKAQLWNMVTTLGRAQCTDNSVPQIEVALYEYGRSSNDAAKGYVKQLNGFTQDLDSVSKTLFNLNTNGGDEYCGQVIYTSLDELKWNAAKDQYKVIFIAGNEDFLQGNVLYTNACAKAKEKGVIVNTIYCGDRQQGIREHWNLLGECGNGSFTNINQNAKIIDIPTPYDSTLIVLNTRLNGTYVAFGTEGERRMYLQAEMDEKVNASGFGAGAQRAAAKSMSNAYNNASWDLVDAVRADSTYISRLDKKTLPDSLKNKNTKELQQYVKQKQEERNAIQKEILSINENRSRYIANEKQKMANAANNGQTLESAVETAIREQVKRYNMVIQKN